MLQTVRCIRFGEILLDENRQALFLLCANCHTEFLHLPDFQEHLRRCEGVEHILQKNAILTFGGTSSQLLGKTLNFIKEYLIYNINDVQSFKTSSNEDTLKNPKDDSYMDMIKIEEELLDPRWYTDMTESHDKNKIVGYNELVEAVTPFVQFKENVKTNVGNIKVKKTTELIGNSLNRHKNKGHLADSLLSKNDKIMSSIKTYPNAKRRLSVQQNLTNELKPYQLNAQQVCENQLAPKTKNKCNEQQQLTKTAIRPQPIKQRRKTIAISKEIKNRPAITAKEHNAHKPQVENIAIALESSAKHVSFSNAIKTKLIPSTTLSIVKPDLKRKVSTSHPTTVTVEKKEKKEKQQTEQILNKLQNLGLQVKRSSPTVAVTSLIEPAKTDKTQELLKKLQSKGMNVKLVTKQPNTTTKLSDAVKIPELDLTNVAAAVNRSIINKNIIIKKVK